MTRQRWHYRGRGVVDGVDSYFWVAYTNAGGVERKIGCARPVADFWPSGARRQP